MRPKTITLTLATPDDNGISVSQKPGAAGNLTITGALASGGVATMDVARHVIITSDGNDAVNTFIVTGTDRKGETLSETISGPNATVKAGVKNFLTVTQVSIDNPAVGNIIVGTNDAAETQPVPLDSYQDLLRYQLSLSSGASFKMGVEYTMDNPWAVGFEADAANWITHKLDNITAFSDIIEGNPRIVRGILTDFTSGTATYIFNQSRL